MSEIVNKKKYPIPKSQSDKILSKEEEKEYTLISHNFVLDIFSKLKNNEKAISKKISNQNSSEKKKKELKELKEKANGKKEENKIKEIKNEYKKEINKSKKEKKQENKFQKSFEKNLKTPIKENQKLNEKKEKNEKEEEKEKIEKKLRSKKKNNSTEKIKSKLEISNSNFYNKIPNGSMIITKEMSDSKININDVRSLTNQNKMIETLKASKDSEKEKKLYEQKVFYIKNRIAALQKQEDDINKKRIKVKLIEKNIEKAQEDKKKIRGAIEKIKTIQDEELKKKKEKIDNDKKNMENKIKNAIKINQEKKHHEYNLALNEKNDNNNKFNQLNKEYEKENSNKIKVIKAERKKVKEEEQKKLIKDEENIKEYYNKIYENNKKETSKLKAEFEKLEKLEQICLENLNNTKKQDKHFISSFRKLNLDKPTLNYRSKSNFAERNGKNSKTYKNLNINKSSHKISNDNNNTVNQNKSKTIVKKK